MQYPILIEYSTFTDYFLSRLSISQGNVYAETTDTLQSTSERDKSHLETKKISISTSKSSTDRSSSPINDLY